MRELSRGEKDMYIIGKLQSKGTGMDSSQRKRQRYMYSYDDREVCKEAFLVLHDIGEKHLKNLGKHVKLNGPVPRSHGNKGKKPKHALLFLDIKRVVNFIVRYSEECGLPLPAVPHGNDATQSPVLLPASSTKVDIHSKYKSVCEESNERSVELSTFKGIWLQCLPHIKIASPRSDVCPKCETLRYRVVGAVSEEDKLTALNDYKRHIEISQAEHAVYRECVHRAREELQAYGDRPLPRSVPCSNQLSQVHYTFDFAQQLTLPHHSRQEGPLYFTSPRKVQLFGVCMEGTAEQYNYLIDENCTIGVDGSQSHGPNTVISMLHHAFQEYGLGEMACHIHCDNCAGQNKNRYVMAFFCWRILVGLHREVTIHFQIPGHTKCLVDAGFFAYIKKLYRRTDNDSLSDLVTTVEKSSKTNRVVVVDEAFLWRDWKTFLAEDFLPLPGIRKYHYFRFSAMNPGVVFVKETSADEEFPISMSRSSTADLSCRRLPQVLVKGDLSSERQRYLYRHVRPFVKDPAKDVTCPAPTEE
uniref:Uncharacterized protein LOC111133299 n=1 Tax=Crassostrea virginica TaxID=6565 RepID=A0A8B8EC74_CRAVI|nr:uncharacterized protein LOC111133299 [Crassostrea virginica]